ncbi:MAG: glycyl radical protein, partial [Clostridiales bacterium]|nr:glycyl radical protein [Clostridiales bacterium]
MFDFSVTERVKTLKKRLVETMPAIESARARLYTEGYFADESVPTVLRKARAFAHVLENIPVAIREDELIVGAPTVGEHACQTFPEFSYAWLEDEFDTLATRAADPFVISEQAKSELKSANARWSGRTTSERAGRYMSDAAQTAVAHNAFTVGNYFYNGVGHVCPHYDWIVNEGCAGVLARVENERKKMRPGDGDFCRKRALLDAMTVAYTAVGDYGRRYAAHALDLAKKEKRPQRKAELERIASVCARVPAQGATSYYEALQSFWFVQMLLQVESSGHSISPGRFDRYIFPFYQKDIDGQKITQEAAQELLDCVFLKFNDLNKVRDAASAEGFAGYGLFQNLIVGGQDESGQDVTNDLSYMCLEAAIHVQLPQPSLSLRVWNGTPDSLLIKAASLTRTGVGLPAYFNDEVIIPALLNRGLTLAEARDYCIIGCVEPQIAGKTNGWHDAAFFNMCRPLEWVFTEGLDGGAQVGPKTPPLSALKTFDDFFSAYKAQMTYQVELLANADNAVDAAHGDLCPLAFLSGMVEDCIGRGLSFENGGAVYNFTGPQGFGIAN